ncbi:Putative dihydroneopterin aldolase protein [Collimonas arenae]|uniref:Putative dihydroneopterin aldolase protein n=1 Tax=Collimonas arenae TaxID=279058 RepID=A0A0A1F802_9BURK|nr:dihydroneopterin aldolase [Collimonas arenae]AIY40646.1 Putative dihydroneopterin aldolase protein [Collimonas arenae]
MKNENIASGVRWQIFVEGLSAMTRVGLYPLEHEKPQAVELDIELSYKTGGRGMHADDAASVIDYDHYCTVVSSFLQGKPHTRLLETLASEVASLSFREFAMLDEIRVAIHKPKIRPNTARLGVASSWTRWSYETLLLQQPAESSVVA